MVFMSLGNNIIVTIVIFLSAIMLFSGCTASTDHYKTSQCGMKIEYNCDCDCKADNIDGLVDGVVHDITH